jgi:prefoldin subunit 5
MPDGGIHEMSSAVGALQADVRSLKESIENLNRTWGQREEAATAGRRDVHEKIDSLHIDVTRLSGEIENVASELAEIKPAINEFKDSRQRAIGARALGGRVWGAMLIAAGFSGYWLHELGTWVHEIVHGVPTPPHP